MTAATRVRLQALTAGKDRHFSGDIMAKYSYEPRSREQFKRDPKAQKLLRQFMKNGGEGGGEGKTSEYRAGYVYTFELSETQRSAVDRLREENEGMTLAIAIALIQESGVP